MCPNVSCASEHGSHVGHVWVCMGYTWMTMVVLGSAYFIRGLVHGSQHGKKETHSINIVSMKQNEFKINNLVFLALSEILSAAINWHNSEWLLLQ